MTDRTLAELSAEIDAAERNLSGLSARHTRLWERLRIAPTKWRQSEYPGLGAVWVIGLLGNRCLCFNPVEDGWGWGRFEQWGEITEFHWQQDDIHAVVSFTLTAIDDGGQG